MEKLPLPEVMTTTRLKLRPPAISDAGAIFSAYAQDPAVCRYMIWKPHASIVVTQTFLSRCVDMWNAGARLPYIVTKLNDDTPIGMLEAWCLGAKVEMGYVLARKHWGKGLMPEAILALAGAALSDPGIFRIQATCDVDNIPSQRALEKAGFLREGRLERYLVHPNISSEPRASFMYAKCR